MLSRHLVVYSFEMCIGFSFRASSISSLYRNATYLRRFFSGIRYWISYLGAGEKDSSFVLYTDAPYWEWNGPCTTVLSLSFSTITQIIKIPLAAIGLFVIFFYTNSHSYCAYNILSYGSPPASPGPPQKSNKIFFITHIERSI